MDSVGFNLKLPQQVKNILDKLHKISGIPRTQIIIQGIHLRGKELIADKKKHNERWGVKKEQPDSNRKKIIHHHYGNRYESIDTQSLDT